jgi:hypothetical protein
MKFSDLLGDESDGATTKAPDAEGPGDSTLGRPAGIPPLASEQPVRFSPVPPPMVTPAPPVPAYDDGPTEVPEYRRSLEPSYRAHEPEPVAFAPVPEPAAPERAPSESVVLEPVVPEPVAVAPEPVAPEPPAPEPPAPEPAPEPLASVPLTFAPEPAPPEPEPIAVLATEPDPVHRAPTAASVFGGQRHAGLGTPAPSADDDADDGPVVTFDLVDDDLLPAARRRSRR